MLQTLVKTLTRGAMFAQRLGSAARRLFTPTDVLADPLGEYGALQDRLGEERTGKLATEMYDALSETRAYHATLTDKVDGDQGILARGLDPLFAGTGASTIGQEMQDDTAGHVYVTRHLDRALEYQRFLEGEQLFGPWQPERIGKAEVLAVSLPKEYADTLKFDPYDGWSLKLDRAIPAEFVSRPAQLGERAMDASEIDPVRQGGELDAIKSHFDPETLKDLDQMGDPDKAFLDLMKGVKKYSPEIPWAA